LDQTISTVSIGSIDMIREATAMTVRQNLGELLDEIQYRQDQVLITKGGKPVAAMVDVALFDKIRLMRKEFDRLTTDLAKVYRDVPADVAENEIAEAVAAVRKR
jgi:prevent-host-death family protein